jgi:hypothetical protein
MLPDGGDIHFEANPAVDSVGTLVLLMSVGHDKYRRNVEVCSEN